MRKGSKSSLGLTDDLYSQEMKVLKDAFFWGGKVLCGIFSGSARQAFEKTGNVAWNFCSNPFFFSNNTVEFRYFVKFQSKKSNHVNYYQTEYFYACGAQFLSGVLRKPSEETFRGHITLSQIRIMTVTSSGT